jgi:diaminohydroxyphosphoribosylaminopyrimidine deaminase/5-amino-6-(5-phosphoribosylamino)uracil reductase
MKSKIKISNNKKDLHFLMQTLELAISNPDKTVNKSVAAVIVKDSRVVGSGFRRTDVLQKNPYKDITYHAEDNAIKEAGENARGGTLYVTLEPCTKRYIIPGWESPKPCCELIVEAGIKKVVIGALDHDFGEGGASYLLKRGIKVYICPKLNSDLFRKLVDSPLVQDPEAKKIYDSFYQNIGEDYKN